MRRRKKCHVTRRGCYISHSRLEKTLGSRLLNFKAETFRPFHSPFPPPFIPSFSILFLYLSSSLYTREAIKVTGARDTILAEIVSSMTSFKRRPSGESSFERPARKGCFSICSSLLCTRRAIFPPSYRLLSVCCVNLDLFIYFTLSLYDLSRGRMYTRTCRRPTRMNRRVFEFYR